MYHTFTVGVTELLRIPPTQDPIPTGNVRSMEVADGTEKVELNCLAYGTDQNMRVFASTWIDWIFTRKELQVRTMEKQAGGKRMNGFISK